MNPFLFASQQNTRSRETNSSCTFTVFPSADIPCGSPVTPFNGALDCARDVQWACRLTCASGYRVNPARDTTVIRTCKGKRWSPEQRPEYQAQACVSEFLALLLLSSQRARLRVDKLVGGCAALSLNILSIQPHIPDMSDESERAFAQYLCCLQILTDFACHEPTMCTCSQS